MKLINFCFLEVLFFSYIEITLKFDIANKYNETQKGSV